MNERKSAKEVISSTSFTNSKLSSEFNLKELDLGG